MANYEYMPVMTDVNAYFDARINAKRNEWLNMVGDINMSLFNPIISTDGIEVVGSNESYGKFTKAYVSGSSRTWYFVFRNTGGVYTNWRTIIGNEVATFKCSTIAMDQNGYIKFTRPDLVPSTSYGFKCSDWHIVAWVSNGSNQTTRLFIDGVLCGSVANMQGWADDTYLSRGSTWSYEDNNTQYRFAAIADSAHSDEDIMSNSAFLLDYFITNYDPNIRQEYVKYLVRNNDTIYTVVDGALSEITGTLNADLFINSGVDTIPDGTLLIALSNPEVLCWTDSDTLPTLVATVQGIPQPQVIVSEEINLMDGSIKGIESVAIDCKGEPVFAVSFDKKASWIMHNGTDWVAVSNEVTGMTKAVFEAITTEQWQAQYGPASDMYIRCTLLNETQSITSITLNFIN